MSPLNRRIPRELHHDLGKYLGLFVLIAMTIAMVSGYLVAVRSIQRTLAELGLPARSDAECAAIIGLPLVECFSNLFPDIDTATAERCADRVLIILGEKPCRTFDELFRLVESIPWEQNEQWLKLLALSGTPLFVSVAPDLPTEEQNKVIAKYLAVASVRTEMAVPLDLTENTTPETWRIDGETVTFRF